MTPRPKRRTARESAHPRNPRNPRNPSPQILDDVMRTESVGAFALTTTPEAPTLVTTLVLAPAALTLTLSGA
jgi:hypothetical protein